ncbi:hypothetical protein ATI61_102507 [Archangium gephyra]|uniref:Uncharacterized protein n=1 Tax=Archangium gephyra TaxID=48 RepID=A0AAC8QDY5_9BACT|nr:hypothetical protein [Archangium gephyra]AKJ05450.1 Hypothetical protein AA314_07076 [Archangium gephyra]REG36133.1 hypothetical protein ATI61_102507 [Archangium gephyra]
MKLHTALRALLPFVLLVSLAASATTMLRTDLPELAQTSEAIVHGTVRRVESRWSGDGRRIITDVEIQVTEALKGQAGGTVLVTQPGGRVGDIGQRVSGLASFTPGEEVVVFLERRGKQAFRVSGMVQGKYQVQRSEDGKSAMAVPEPTGDALLLDRDSRQPTVSTQRSLSLPELKAAIRTALEQKQAPARAQEKRP